MQYIGKLDVEKLGKYKEKVVTDDVILTEERIKKQEEARVKALEKAITLLSLSKARQIQTNPKADEPLKTIDEAKKLGYDKVYLKSNLINYYEKFGAIFIERLSNGENLYYINI